MAITMMAYSNRIYKNTLDINSLTNLKTIFYVFNEAKIHTYSYLAYNKPLNQSLHLEIKSKFKLNTYYSNFAVREAKATYSSNKELQKLYIKNIKEQIKTIEGKIKNLNDKLVYWNCIHKYIVSLTKDMKNNKVSTKLKSYRPFKFINQNNKIIVQNYLKGYELDLYNFNHKIVEKRIANFKNRINIIKIILTNKQNKLAHMEKNIPLTLFGGKKLAKARTTTYTDQIKWKNDFYNARHSIITLQGCNTATQGNFVVRYNSNNKELNIMLPSEQPLKDGKKNQKAEWFKIPGVEFKYNLNHLTNAYKQKQPVAYTIEDKGLYYLVKAIFEVEFENHINYSTADGVIAYDINVDHLAVSNLSKDGNILKLYTIKFNLQDKTTNQAKAIIEKVAKDLVEISIKEKKPLVGEDISNINKSDMKYKNTNRNRKISAFAYSKLITSIKRRAYKLGVEVILINPKYTSQIGKLKYLKIKGLSIHHSASYVIGRRGLGYKEKLNGYKKYFKSWAKTCFTFKKLRAKNLYVDVNIKDCVNIKDFQNKILIKNAINNERRIKNLKKIS